MLAGETVEFGKGPCSFLGKRPSVHRKQQHKCQQRGSELATREAAGQGQGQGMEGVGSRPLMAARPV